jgi:pimeloyl-ACP methyl ester carboxylesterase
MGPTANGLVPTLATGAGLSLMMLAWALPQGAAQPRDPLAAAQPHSVLFGTNKVHYLTLGQGRQTLLFVHGWACRGDFWRAQAPALESKARLILIDLPGHGQSDKPRTAYTMDYFARAVLAVLADAKVEKATLVGHSMGVPVICRAQALAAEKVSALVAVDGLLRRPTITPEQAEQFIGFYRTPDYREHATRFVRSFFPPSGADALRDRVVADMLQTPQHVMLGAMEGMFGPGQPAWDLPKVSFPLLVLNAQNPRWTAEYEAYVRGLSSQGEYRTIEGAGHFLMLEKPAEFNAALVELLQQHGLIGK